MRPTQLRTSFLVAIFCVFAAAGGFGQTRTRTVYAIRDARIYPVSGPMIPRGTIVIRNGLIEAVGADIQIPAEATVIPGAGLTVYPGLIDSFTDVGLPNAPPAGLNGNAGGPPGAQQQQQQFPKNAHEAIFQTPMGLNADRVLADQVRPEGRNIDTYRNLGITSALIVSRDGILTGQSAFINTSDTNLVVKAPVALHINPIPVRGGYPSTLMGSFAVLRQAFADADWYRQAWQAFNTNPRGIERPKYDAVLESVAAVMQGKLPSVIHADWTDQIKRAVALADELKLKPIIAGGMEAGSVASLLKGKDIPVLVSVNYATEKPKAGFGGTTEPVEFDEKELQDFNSNASLLQKAGVRFALQSGFADRPQAFIENIQKTMENGLTLDQALRATTLSAAEILGLSNAIGSLEPGKIANIVVATGDPFARDTRIRQVFIDGRPFEVAANQTTSNTPAGNGTPPAQQAPAANAARKAVVRLGRYITPTPKEVLIRNATILTVTKGTIKNGSILLRDGKIAAIGTNVSASTDAKVIDGTGKFVMPGIIDAHSHMAIEGGGNESTSPVTPNVRIADVIRADDITIYRALAGGTTVAHILHGSANVIGGTDAVIKLKWGRPAEEFLFGAPLGIKFALGENPKRSNQGVQGQNQTANRRFPATRLGVEETLRESFTEARRYMKEWDDYEAAKRRGDNRVPPQRDLKLETLADILRGKIIVHVHSYVAPEIVMMLNIADEFGFKVGTLHHVLEGYKVAKEIAAHGAGASTFADFWSYKWEAWDAIPYNAAVMAKRGIVVTVNSDSDERVRRLYEEAARALHYSNGELTEDDALKMITLNAAIQLGIEKRVGSIEVGKDADLAIFSAHPFSSAAHVDMTLVDGQIYFDRDEDIKNRAKGETQ
jgi:imidazolonepropionase-like amidohydrolase